MADSVLLPFQFIESATNLVRDIAAHDVNQTLTNLQVDNCSRILDDARADLEAYQNLFEEVKHVNAPQKELSLFSINQSAKLVKLLSSTLGLIKEKNNCWGSVAFPTVMKELLSEFQSQLSDLNGKLEKLYSYLKDLHDESRTEIGNVPTGPDCYVVTNMVQPNPNYIFLDFEDPEAPESLVKDAIFNTGSNSTMSAVAYGMGGVGKTSAVRGVGRLEEMKKRFPGGVLFMSLGADAGKFDLIRNLAVFMKETGGHQPGREVEREDEISKAVSLTAKWFEPYCCLFIIDDIWCQKGIESSVTVTLARLASNKGSKVVFTTRDIKLESDILIPFKKRGVLTSEKILWHSAGLKKHQPKKMEQLAMDTLLEMADGIPITLAVIGSRARHFMQHRKVDMSVVWSEVCDEYEQSNALISEDAFRNERNEKVLNVLLLSLKMIHAESEEQNYGRLFACFSILQNRQKVPFDIAQRMWGFDAKKTRDIMGILERFSTVEVSHWFKGQRRKCFIVHDLFLDVARHLASLKPGLTASTSKLVLNSYVPPNSECVSTDQNLAAETPSVSAVWNNGGMKINWKRMLRMRKAGGSSTAKKDVPMTDVISSVKNGQFHKAWATVPDDGFSRLNIFRLLHIAGMHNEGIALLLDPRWVTEQVNLFSRKQFNDDAAIILKHVEQRELRDQYASCAKAIRMVKAAVTESEPHFNNASGAGALWSQLYGRLSHLSAYEFITPFVGAIEKCAPAPWVRSQGVLPVPTASTGKVMVIPNALYLRSTSGYVDIINRSQDQLWFHLHRYFPEEDNVHLEKRWSVPHELDANIEEAALSRDASTLAVGCKNDILLYMHDSSRDGTCARNVVTLRQHKKAVKSVSISADGKSLISGGGDDGDGEVIMWELTNCVWQSTLLQGHTGGVRAVKLCPDISKAVSGAEDKTVRLWTKLEGGGWRSELLEGHGDWVNCVDLSDDGRFVASGGHKIVRVFEKRSTHWAMSELEGHSGCINDVALDTNRIRIVSASDDSTVRLWERHEGVWSSTATLQGHRGWAMRATISLNRGEIFTSGDDDIIRMWDVGRDCWETKSPHGHTADVWDVAVSGDRRRVVSGSRDETVRLWEKDGSAWKGSILKKHAGQVAAVAISSSGRLIVSGSFDGTACVFEEQNARWASNELTGHTNWVMGVAISLDGKAVATASLDATVKIWRRIGRSWELINTLEGHTRYVNSVALNKDGSLVVSGSHDQTVRVWNIRRGRLITVQTLSGHEDRVSAVTITPDGSTICSGDYRGTVKLWAQSAAGDWVNITIGNLNIFVNKVAFSPDGSFLRAEEFGGKLTWFAQRDGAWAEYSDRGGVSAADCGMFGDSRLDRQHWPHPMGQVLEQTGGLWNLGNGWYFAQTTHISIAGIAHIIR